MLAALAVVVALGCDRGPVTPSGDVTMFGALGLGPGRFARPRGIAVGPDNTIYVVDKSGRIQRFGADGAFQRLWSMREMEAGQPVGLWVAPDHRVFVADTHYHRVIVFDREGNELARFGHAGRGEGEFEWPTDVVMDADGYVYVGEYGGNDRITKWSPAYEFVSVLVGGEVGGKRLNRPAGLAMDDEQTLWVADACNHRVLRLGLDGSVRTQFGRMGREPGELRYPYDLAVTPQGVLVVCEYGNCRLQWFDKTGRSLATWGSEGRERGRLWSPWGVAIGPNGRICVSDSLNERVQVIAR